jgi:hypothetical protein
MTPLDIIGQVRTMLQDTNTVSTLQRYSDDTLLGFVNQTLKRMAVLRPDLFAYIGEIPCTSESVLQSMPSDSLRVMEIFQVKNGEGVRETNREILDQTYPAWVGELAGPCVNWMRHVRNANKFFIYPKAPAGQVLIGEYSQCPKDYALAETIEIISEAYLPVIVDGTLFLAESIDNEHVNSNRAQLFQQAFFQSLGSSIQARTMTDTENAGLQDKEVI